MYNYVVFLCSGIVRHDCGDNSYIVEDGVGDLEKIWREDILADQDDDGGTLVVSEGDLLPWKL